MNSKQKKKLLKTITISRRYQEQDHICCAISGSNDTLNSLSKERLPDRLDEKVVFRKAEFSDLKEILDLQHIAYRSEACLVNNFTIQPLMQTYDEIVEEFQKGVFYKAIKAEKKIIGSIRGRVEDGTLYLGKLIVSPEEQGQGIGTQLLGLIESEYPCLRKELFTSNLSNRNLTLYEKNGYKIFNKIPTTKGFDMVYLEK
jgi:ribosomal protein S18 acetylase RimI-like enzyme